MQRLVQSLTALAIAVAVTSALQSDPSEGSTRRNDIGYPTVAAALEALRVRDDVKISMQGGWTIMEEQIVNTIWSFTPPGHPAHPAAVKRTYVERDGAVSIEMTVLCQSKKAACETLVEEFQSLHERMRELMKPARAPAERRLNGNR